MSRAPTSWLEALADAAVVLKDCGVEAPVREARLLLAEALGSDAAGVIAIERDAPSADSLTAFRDCVAARAGRKPLSRIRGWREFYGRRFAVTQDVLDPRPDTETLVEAALKHLPEGGRVLDLGTGSGCILLTLLAERPDVRGVGVDLSPGALKVASANAEALGVFDRVQFVEGGWDATGGFAPFDILASNPPYIPSADIDTLEPEVRLHDPALALDGGEDGLGAYRAISELLARLVRPGGWALFEVGIGQASDVVRLLVDAGCGETALHEDLAGRRRVVAGRVS